MICIEIKAKQKKCLQQPAISCTVTRYGSQDPGQELKSKVREGKMEEVRRGTRRMQERKFQKQESELREGEEGKRGKE
jgi:hypothetical protein